MEFYITFNLDHWRLPLISHSYFTNSGNWPGFICQYPGLSLLSSTLEVCLLTPDCGLGGQGVLGRGDQLLPQAVCSRLARDGVTVGLSLYAGVRAGTGLVLVEEVLGKG